MPRSISLLAVLGLVAAACGPKQASTADEYYTMAAENFRLGAYGQAVEQYRNLLDEHPFSEYSEEAELQIGIAHYKDNSCPEATAAFTDFQRRHPTSPHLPLVGYLLGRCAEEQMQPFDRDQSASQNAHSYFQALIQQHPTSPYAELARERLQYCRETLASHELQIATYYEGHDNKKAAETRLLDLVNRFNDTDIAGDALLQLGELYKTTGQNERAVLAFSAVQYHHPDHDAARKAERELEELTAEGDRPTGDPWVVLRAESGRSRTIAIAQTAPRGDGKQPRRAGAPTGPGTGFGLPTSSGPFGRGGSYPGRY
jgi:outer membrane protein assembly factor BamD